MARPSKRQKRELDEVARRQRRGERLYQALLSAVRESREDALLVRCDGCGLVQVDSGQGPFEHHRPCVLCGSASGTYAGEAPCIVEPS